MGYIISVSITEEQMKQWNKLPKMKRSKLIQALLTEYFNE